MFFVFLILMQYWERESKTALVNSALDVLDQDFYYIPKSVAPVFIEYDEPKLFWENWEACFQKIEGVASREPDVQELVGLAQYIAFFHELTHCRLDHAEFYNYAVNRILSNSADITEQELGRGLELQADVQAAETTISFISCALRGQLGEDEAAERRPLQFLRLGYAYTMFFAATDTWRRKFLVDYDEERYCHPVIRHIVSVEATTLALVRQESNEVAKMWSHFEKEGWMRCLWAFNDLTVHAYVDTEKATPGKYPGPLHCMLYGIGGPTGDILEKKRKEAEILYNKINDLVNQYLEKKSG